MTEPIHPQGEFPPGQPPQHRPLDVSVRAIGVFVIVLVLSVAVAFSGVTILFGVFSRALRAADVEPSPLAGLRVGPPEPRLQVSPRRDMERMRVAEEALLGSYGWVDREAGVARVPIDEAMRWYIERGQHEPPSPPMPQPPQQPGEQPGMPRHQTGDGEAELQDERQIQRPDGELKTTTEDER